MLGTAAFCEHCGSAMHSVVFQHLFPATQQSSTSCVAPKRLRLHGETVPASEKLVSLFEPHTAIVRRGKAHLPPRSVAISQTPRVLVGTAKAAGGHDRGYIVEARSGGDE